MKKCLNMLSDWTNKIIVPIASIIFVILGLATVIQVVARYFLETSMPWTEELARYAFIWSTLLGASVLVKSKGHPGVDAITGKLKGQVKIVQEALLAIVIMIIAAVGIRYGIELVQITMGQTSAALNIPYGFIYLSFPVSCIAMIIHELSELADLVQRSTELRKGKEV